jgi:PA domain/Secretion system C-terminal sorting domain
MSVVAYSFKNIFIHLKISTMRKRLLLFGLLFSVVVVGFGQRRLTVNLPANLAGNLVSGHGTADAGWTGQIIKAGRSVSGDLVIGIDSTSTDTLVRQRCCTKVSNAAAVRGKFVLIRRGDCNFSVKAQNAQAAGATGIIIYTQLASDDPFDPGGGEAGITIPVGMIGFNDAQKLIAAIRAGQRVNLTFSQPSFVNHYFYGNMQVPQKEAVRFNVDGAGVSFINPDSVTANVEAKFEIRTPSNRLITLRSTRSIPADDKALMIRVTDTFVPREIGRYIYTITNNKTRDTILDSIRITPHTFAEDRGGVINSAAATDSATFVLSGRVFDVGHFYTTGVSPDRVTHGSFALANPERFPRGDAFVLELYEMTDAILTKMFGGTLSYADLPSVGTAIYEMKGTERPYQLMVAPFSPTVTLKDTSLYLLMVRYDGSANPRGTVPQYAMSGSDTNDSLLVDMVYSWNATAGRNNFYYSGWVGGAKNVVRMHMQGYNATSTKNLPDWNVNSINVYPNPSANIVSLEFNLENLNKQVEVVISDVMGSTIMSRKLQDVQKLIYPVNVSNFANGTYFVKVIGQDGWQTKVFQVIR